MSFDITANFSEDFADYPRVESAINNAITKWESIITGDIPDVTNAQVEKVGTISVDDIRIDFNLENDVNFGAITTTFDEKGGFRSGYSNENFDPAENDLQNALPFYSQVSFNDTTAGDETISDEIFTNIAFHEIAHALGFSTTSDLFELFGVAENIDAENVEFTGSNAVEAYNEIFDNDEDFVPIVTEEGGHWSKSELGNEILTPTIESNSVISEVTLGAMADIGYDVDLSQADPTLPTPQAEDSESSESSDILIEDEVVAATTYTPDTAGDSENYFTGTSGDDFLVGSKSDDFLTGREGSDTFVIELGQGSDVISDFVDGQDYIGLSNGLGASELNIFQSNDDTLIQDSQDNTLATLQGIDDNIISTDDFVTI